MIEMFANISFGLVVVFGFVLIGGFLLVANLTDRRNVLHPGGTRGRFQDEILVVAPVAPMLVMIVAGAVAPHLRDQNWWFPVLAVLGLIGFFASFLLPVVSRARSRIEALRRGSEPSQ